MAENDNITLSIFAEVLNAARALELEVDEKGRRLLDGFTAISDIFKRADASEEGSFFCKSEITLQPDIQRRAINFGQNSSISVEKDGRYRVTSQGVDDRFFEEEAEALRYFFERMLAYACNPRFLHGLLRVMP